MEYADVTKIDHIEDITAIGQKISECFFGD
jgi:hypothetical protein